MSAPSDSSRPSASVFLSYASEDRPAAQTLKEALSAFGLDVWYDESGLNGGDAWDQKIRRQIRECDFFIPLISAETEARPEGYFRREWRLAVERTLDMADDHTFLLPSSLMTLSRLVHGSPRDLEKVICKFNNLPRGARCDCHSLGGVDAHCELYWIRTLLRGRR
jgi:hypothetical protein